MSRLKETGVTNAKRQMLNAKRASSRAPGLAFAV
jgi:hypothetical protein